MSGDGLGFVVVEIALNGSCCSRGLEVSTGTVSECVVGVIVPIEAAEVVVVVDPGTIFSRRSLGTGDTNLHDTRFLTGYLNEDRFLGNEDLHRVTSAEQVTAPSSRRVVSPPADSISRS